MRQEPWDPGGPVDLAWSSISQLGQSSGQKDRGAQDTVGWDPRVLVLR